MTTNGLFRRGLLIFGIAVFVAGYAATIAEAQTAANQGTPRRTGIDLGPTQTANTANGDLTLRRATQLLRRPLKNTHGAKLGTIDELVLTPDLGNVSYAVLTRGGLFGFGERRYAIPWSVMQAGVGDTIVAPIDKQELDQDRGFPARLWPAEGNARWLSRAGERTEQVTFDVQPPVTQKDIRRRRVGKLLGTPVRDLQNDRVGRIQDMVIAMNTGDIPFTVVGYGGILGLGNKYTAVPADAIQIRPAESLAIVQVDKQILQANAFNPGDFPDLSDPTYAQRLYTAYNVPAEAPDWTVLGYIPPTGPGGTRPLGTLPAQPRITGPAQPETAQQQPAQSQPIPGIETPETPATSPARSEYLAAFSPDNIRTIEGVVTGVSSFQQVGTNAEWVQLQVRTDDGELATVHLGPRDYVGRQDFYVASNDRITLTGAQATAWRQPIILPITATVGAQTITLRDPTGAPLWNKVVEPQQDLSEPTP